MSVRILGMINFLSGHYQDITISESSLGKFNVSVSPNKLYSVKELDNSYYHDGYKNIADLDKVNKIIDTYLDNNIIFMLTSNSRLKNHAGYYQGINAYNSFISGLNGISRSLYLKIVDRNLSDVMCKIRNKYNEDRIRHLEKILGCKKIYVNISLRTTGYYINGDEAYVTILSKKSKDFLRVYPVGSDMHFLELLLKEFIKENGYYKTEGYPNGTIELYGKDYNKSMELDDWLMPYVLKARKEINGVKEKENNITIDEYLESLGNLKVKKLKK